MTMELSNLNQGFHNFENSDTIFSKSNGFFESKSPDPAKNLENVDGRCFQDTQRSGDYPDKINIDNNIYLSLAVINDRNDDGTSQVITALGEELNEFRLGT